MNLYSSNLGNYNRCAKIYDPKWTVKLFKKKKNPGQFSKPWISVYDILMKNTIILAVVMVVVVVLVVGIVVGRGGGIFPRYVKSTEASRHTMITCIP